MGLFMRGCLRKGGFCFQEGKEGTCGFMGNGNRRLGGQMGDRLCI